MTMGSIKVLMMNIHYFERKKKKDRFDSFRKQHLNMTQYYPDIGDLRSISNYYDGYITGSDQVWNAEFTDNQIDPAYTLEFVDKNIPCFSYAASTGGVKSDDYLLDLLSRVDKFKMISVREKSLADALERIGGENIYTHIDPVLLLSRDDWDKLTIKPQKTVPSHYILLYYLEKETKKDILIHNIASKLGLPVIDISSSGITENCKWIYDWNAGPGEFLYYIEHADYVVTNSFHAVVFSLIFKTKFIACNRIGQESRIKDLLNSIGLEKHLISSNGDWSSLYEPVFQGRELFINQIDEAYNYLHLIKEIIIKE